MAHLVLQVKVTIKATITKNKDIPIKNAGKLLLILGLLLFVTMINIFCIYQLYLLQMQISKQKQRFIQCSL